MTTILKLGGSVVTEKDEPETLDEPALDRAADAIGEAHLDDLVVVHGGGSFGHHNAAKYGVSAETGTHDAVGVFAIHAAMRELNTAVVQALQNRGVSAVPVHPFSLGHRDSSGATTLPSAGVERMLDEGFVPVLHGDVVVQQAEGVTILSGDEIVVLLASALSAERVGLCSGVPGVFDGTGAVIERIDDFEAVADALGASDATDVTGGMAAKVRELLNLPMPAVVFGLDDLDAFLAGQTPGTLVAGRP
jgi:isopentenyl phosphate kinase